MSQVSYGTITITDTNDIERIYTVYAKSAKNTVVPSADKEDWSENVSNAPGTGNYIWQRTVVEKSGTGDKTYSSPVCLTGEEAKDIIAIEVQYGISANWDTQPQSSSWSADTPSYDSSKPNYWTRTRLKYEGNTYSSWVVNKDYALTEAIYNSVVANSIAQQTIEDSQGAMSQAASAVKEVKRIWFARATSDPPEDPPETGVTTGSASTYNSWSIIKPAENPSYPYYFYCDQTCTNGGVYSHSEILLEADPYTVNAMNVRTKNFFHGKDSTYDGWFASGRATSEGLDESNAATYHYNARFAASHVTLGYNKTPVIDLDGTSGAINIYRLPTINSSTGLVTAAGSLGAKLNASALTFYNRSGTATSTFGDSIALASNGASITIGSTSTGKYNTHIDAQGLYLQTGTTPYATLNSNGLVLSKGGVNAGTSNTNNYVYISSENGPRIAINGYTPPDPTAQATLNAPQWREIIGTKFGVLSDGTLYAYEAHISGEITASKLTINSNATISDTSGLIRNDAVEIGGRNLLKKSNEPRNNSDYAIGSWYFGEDPPKEGETVTIQIKGKLADAKTKWGVYNSGGSVSVFFIYPSAYDSTTGIYTYTGPWKITLGSTTASNVYMRIYAMESGQSGTSTIEWVKLERGNKPSDWTAAPEDAGGGGKNLLYNSGIGKVGGQSVKGWRASGGTVSHVDLSSSPVSGVTGAVRVTNNDSSAAKIGIAQDGFANSFIAGELYSQGAWIRGSSAFTCYLQPIWNDSNTTGNSNDFAITTDWQYYKVEGLKLLGTQQSTYSAGYFYARNVPTGGWVEVCGMKLERGAKATDWTPAPEDVASDIEDASKVANSFLKFESGENGGLMVADLNGASNTTIHGIDTRNVLIDPDSVDIREGQNVLASFGAITTLGDKKGVHTDISPSSISFSDDTAVFGSISMANASFPFLEATSALFAATNFVIQQTPDGRLGVYKR